MTITVYTKPSCVQCEATKRSLDKLDLDYETIDVTTDEVVYEMLVEKGFKAMPVVNANGEWWSGFQPDKINGLVD
jgi:glutaredoxin-like protein NrdH